MELTILEKAMAENGVKIGFLNKNLYKLLAPKIGDDEKILAAGEGFSSKSSSKVPLVVTDKNVFIAQYTGAFIGLGFSIIPINRVTSVNISGKILRKLIITEGTVAYEVDTLQPNQADKIQTSIRDAQNNATASNTVINTQSAADEIRKMKALLDDGIINEDEFNAKKKELLGV